MIVPILLFVLGLILLIKGGDWFVDSAVHIAERFHLPKILIGATVVSIGTTVPEVMVSATSALSGHGEIAYGNAIGSIICNTALIAAITMAVKPGAVERKSLKWPLAFFFVASAIYFIMAYGFGYFSRTSGVILLLLFLIYITMQIVAAKNSIKGNKESADNDSKEEPLLKSIVMLIVGAVVIAIGANLLVENGTLIAQALGVPESVIALTFVALGTSLPELVTAVTSLVKGQSDLSLGNVIGANLFNLVLVCGTSITLSPFALPSGKTLMGYNSSLVVDMPLMLGVMLILSVPAIIKNKLYRAQGIILLLIYGSFCVYQFM